MAGVLQGTCDEKVFCSTMESPLGRLWLASTRAGLVKVALPGEDEHENLGWLAFRFPGAVPVDGADENEMFVRQLDEYFAGSRMTFDCPVRLVVRDFTRRVLEATSCIPCGETRSYGEIAVAVGSPSAARAVGRSLATNPVPIIIPCHRVVGSDGSLVGFGGGLRIKEWLLAHERRATAG